MSSSTISNEIINFDLICGSDFSTSQSSKYDFKQPFRMLIVGPSGSGKSNVLINLLIRYLKYTELYIYCKHKDEKKYQFIEWFFEQVRKNEALKLSKKEKCEYEQALNSIPSFCHVSDNLSELNIDNFDSNEENVIVIDDFVLEANQKNVIEMFISGRHKNCSIIYISQTYYRIPKDIRINCSYLLLFNIPSTNELNMIIRDQKITMSKDELIKKLKQAFSIKFNFITIDNISNDPTLNIRQKLFQPI